ncbi:flexible cuticle protein 12-like [Amphibalanus amphitrite]|uniref:flexible cuticle protein 12-like n=1 Tax=Amphibalanus amphitrite TaxID=1232801 RepID=UPI001C910DD3|nr:flexible cuticle protein 12-like [Amphibalanus amphitrite]
MQMFVAILLVAAAWAAPFVPAPFVPVPDFSSAIYTPDVRVLSQRFDQVRDGDYEYGYELSNGQRIQETGRVDRASQPQRGRIEQRGNFVFIADDGNTYRVDYLANEGGFQPQAAHLPVAPAQIPEYDQLRQEHPELFWAENAVNLGQTQFI